jgi:hypothetical protein
MLVSLRVRLALILVFVLDIAITLEHCVLKYVGAILSLSRPKAGNGGLYVPSIVVAVRLVAMVRLPVSMTLNKKNPSRCIQIY